MATNNYFGFTHGGTQYTAAATGTPYQTGQAGYAVATPASAAATYGTRATGYETPYQAQQAAAYATAGATTYDYGYGQTAAAGYTTGYDQSAAVAATAKPATYATTYNTQRATQPQQVQVSTATSKPGQYTTTYQANSAAYQATYVQPVIQTTVVAAQPTTQAKATMYVAQHAGGQQKTGGWQGFRKGGIGAKNIRTKAPPKPQQLHYCEVCKISCAGPQTYQEHLEGQKHKKREAASKMAASVAVTSQNRSGNSLRCQLCDVTCTGNDAYAAHIRGAKHQKVVLLHTKLGKPIPPQEPEVLGGAKKSVAGDPKINFVQGGGLGATPGNGELSKEDDDDTPEADVQPVGQDYIEEIKSDDGKVISFNCKLCECRFSDPNAKEMHMKGRRHRLQYKKKVDPNLVVDVKPSLRQRKIQDEKMRRAAMREEFWARRNEDGYWDDRRRYEDEYMGMGSFHRGRPFPGGPPPYYAGMPRRRTESSDDKHVMARHAEIYPKDEELQSIQNIVSNAERALKIVSDQIADAKNQGKKPDAAAVKTEGDSKAADMPQKEDGRDNQLFTFQQGDNTRILKGVMRVEHLSKGLILRGETKVHLVVLCADKPTLTLLKKVVELLPAALKQIAPEEAYRVAINAPEAGLNVAGKDGNVLVQFTSPVIRELQEAASGGFDRDVLSRGKCLEALAALRHTKWFQARALGLPVIIIRILRDLCERVPTWAPLSSWAMELLTEKVISSVPGQTLLSPGDALRRIMEAVASGILLPGGTGLADPCEKDSPDACAPLSAQQREDLTCSAQHALRLIAFRQIYKVLGMEPLPPPKNTFRDRFGRKRRAEEQEGTETDGGKQFKTEAAENAVNTVK